MSKIWEKIHVWIYCKFLLLPFKCESQSRPEKPDIKEISSHCDKNSVHNIGANTNEHPYWNCGIWPYSFGFQSTDSNFVRFWNIWSIVLKICLKLVVNNLNF